MLAALVALALGWIETPGSPRDPLWTAHGVSAWDGFGVQAVRLSDWDGDGIDELAVGALGRSYVQVLRGRDGGLLRTLHGPPGFGAALAAPDADGDGIRDLAVGAPWAPVSGPDVGVLQILSGADGRLLLQLAGEFPGNNLGHRITRVSDADGDGADDLLVGQFGGSDLLVSARSGEKLGDIEPAANQAVLLGDADGDGLPDRVLLAPSGTAVMLLPAAAGDGPSAWTFHLPGAVEGALRAAASAGDVDGDGCDDLIVGAPGDDGFAPDAGCAWVLSGTTGEVLFVVHGAQRDERLGSAVGGLGDVDGDGRSEVFVTGVEGPGENPGLGFVRVFRSPGRVLPAAGP